MKKSPLKKKSKQKISTIQNRLWSLCKIIIRTKYGNDCYTCDKRGLIGSDWHTAHFIPKASCGAFLKYDLRNLRPCCYNCNINLGGNGSAFYRKLIAIEGKEYVDKLFEDKKITVKAIDHYLQLIPKYEAIIRDMEASKRP